jgi:biotin-(acetyl-CoA carboxylase) ligase
MVTVKWPNDVLVNERKISGVLIESSSNGWLLIGIGVNLASAPVVDTSGQNRGRPATSIAALCPETVSSTLMNEETAERFGIDLGYALYSFLLKGGTGRDVLNEWTRWIDFDMELVLRDTPGQERVKITDILPDGRIQVQHIHDGRIQTLVSDYFL